METLDFTSPKESKSFTLYWDRFIGDIKDRPNLKPSHLWQLQVLCDLCVEYDFLKEIITIIGYSSTNGGGRNGIHSTLNPEVGQYNKVLVEIRNYSKMLDLVLYKDKKIKDEEEDNEFK